MCLSVEVDLVRNLWKKVGKFINSWHFEGWIFLLWPVLVFWP